MEQTFLAFGDLATAISGVPGAHVVGIHRPSGAQINLLFDTGVSPRAWRLSGLDVGPFVYTAASGLPAGDGLDIAPGIELDDALAVFTGPASRLTDDGVTYATAGVPPSQVYRVQWERGQRNVYIGAATGGIAKTIDGGANWGYVRPHAGIGTTWPAGAVGRDIAFLGAPPRSTVPDLYVVGTIAYKRLEGTAQGTWVTKDGAPPATSGRHLRYYGEGVAIHQTGTNGQIRFSDDKGDSWATRALPASVSELTGFDRSPDGTIWVFGKDAPGTTGYIYRSADDGANWTLSTSFSVTGTGSIAVSPGNSNNVAAIYTTTANALRARVSQNAGTSWTERTVNALDNALSRQASGQAHWVGTRLVVAVQETANGNVRVYWTSDYGANWTLALTVDTGTTADGNLAEFIAGGHLGPLFVALNYTSGQQTARILRSVDQGQTWDQLALA